MSPTFSRTILLSAMMVLALIPAIFASPAPRSQSSVPTINGTDSLDALEARESFRCSSETNRTPVCIEGGERGYIRHCKELHENVQEKVRNGEVYHRYLVGQPMCNVDCCLTYGYPYSEDAGGPFRIPTWKQLSDSTSAILESDCNNGQSVAGAIRRVHLGKEGCGTVCLSGSWGFCL